MNINFHRVSSLIMAGLLYSLPQTGMSASCTDDAKLCQDSKILNQSIVQDKSSSVLTSAKTELKQDVDIATGEINAKTTSTTVVAKLDKALEDKLRLINNECSPLRWTEERTIIFDQEVVANPRNRSPDAGIAGPMGMKVEPPNARTENLATGMNMLTPVDVGEPVSTILTPPVSITGASLIGSLPGNLQFDFYNGQIAIYTPCENGLQTRLVHPSTTTLFNIQLHTASGSMDVDVVLPVDLYTPAIIQQLNPGNNVDRILEFSGGPASCAGMPGGVPCGMVNWSYQAVAGGPIPQGITLQSLPDGRGHLHGSVQDAAYSSGGKIELSQQQASFQTDAIFEVPVSLPSMQLTQLAEVKEIERNNAYSFQLPQPRGGDGFNYIWSVGTLPDGLTLSGNTISGTVSPGADIGTRNVRLTVTSSLNYTGMRHLDAAARMTFHLAVPFNLWTQNSFMRPPDLPQAIHDAVDTQLNIFSVIGGWILCGPPCAGAGFFTSEIIDSEVAQAIESAYDSSVQNTTADNQQRMSHILNRVSTNNYDIVALQEVFQFDPAENGGNTLAHITQLRSGAGPQYHLLDGPSAVGLEMNSGLSLMVRKGLTPNTQFNHAHDVYSNVPLMVNVSGSLIPEPNFDALAQKGMTYDQVHFGPNADDYVQVINTHMQAQPGVEYDTLRAAQQNELYNFILLNADSAHPLIILGDFNVIEKSCPNPNSYSCPGMSRLQTPEYLGMLNRLGLGLDSDQLRSQQNSYANVDAFTIDPSRNLYASNWGGLAIERLDYILVRQGSQYQLVADSVEMTDAPVTTTQCSDWQAASASSRQCYLSDHYGLSAQLRLVRQQ